MELSQNITKMEITTDKISYNKKTNILSANIFDFMFVGTYKKNIRISKVLDDIYASLGDVQFEREDIYILDFDTQNKIHGNTKLKNLNILSKKKPVKAKGKKTRSRNLRDVDKKDVFKFKDDEVFDEDFSRIASSADEGEDEFTEELDEFMGGKASSKADDEKPVKLKEKAYEKSKKSSSSTPPPSPGGGARREPAKPSAPRPKPAPAPPPSSDVLAESRAPAPPPAPAPAPASTEPVIRVTESEDPQSTVYEINMGLQYFSVMMEQRSYLFYVYFSHEELKIVDEEGKTIYKTTVKIVTTKKEPPVLDLKIGGDGFEVHPLLGKVEVKKDAVNPPVMIFSIMPLKSNQKKKEGERRFLKVNIEFEEKIISHTILSIIVQPKFFRLEIGPLHLNLSKKTAVIISFISILIAGISLVWIILSISPSSGFMDYLGGLIPGLGSMIFIVVFLYTLLKEGIYPLKEKISGFLNFDQAGVLIK